MENQILSKGCFLLVMQSKTKLINMGKILISKRVSFDFLYLLFSSIIVYIYVYNLKIPSSNPSKVFSVYCTVS